MGKTHADFCPRICPLVGPHIAQSTLRLWRPVLQSTDYSESSSSAVPQPTLQPGFGPLRSDLAR